jgi:starch synthase (maltosyl-transferring)
VIPNALPLDEIDSVKPGVPQELGVPADTPVVLFVGRFDVPKNVPNLMAALRKVVQRSNAMAILVGSGPQQADIEASNDAFSSRILVKGYQPQIWAWMKYASVFVSVSHFEGMPNTVMEAMACACPLVLSDIPQHRMIADHSSCTFVDPNDPEHIARGVLDVLNNQEESKRQAKCAQLRTSEWSQSLMAERYERAYLEVLEDTSRRFKEVTS